MKIHKFKFSNGEHIYIFGDDALHEIQTLSQNGECVMDCSICDYHNEKLNYCVLNNEYM
jgi:hypothetical protein